MAVASTRLLAAEAVAAQVQEVLQRGGLDTTSGEYVPLIPGLQVQSVKVADTEGRGIVVVMRVETQDRLTVARRIALVDEEDEWDHLAAEYADLHVIEDFRTCHLSQVLAQQPDEQGMRWI